MDGSEEDLIGWLLRGDVSVQYQATRDLLGKNDKKLQTRISQEGWGSGFLSRQKPDGHWGDRFYQPKWISTHYTLLDLKNLGIARDTPPIQRTLESLLEERIGEDGGISLSDACPRSDMCVNGMFLCYAAYFGAGKDRLKSLIDIIIRERMSDGGWNCCKNRAKPVHSSLHSTISVLEGIREYEESGYRYRLEELRHLGNLGREFILKHRLYKSDKTGSVIDPKMLMLSYPSRWYYDILRALDHFRAARVPFDPRMQDALEVLLRKRSKDGTWPVQHRHAGQVHFHMERTGGPSRWNTLRALRVLAHFGFLQPVRGSMAG